jgi:hypothetical protein
LLGIRDKSTGILREPEFASLRPRLYRVSIFHVPEALLSAAPFFVVAAEPIDGAKSRQIMGRTPLERARARRYDPSTQQPGFREPTSDAFGVLRSQRLPGDVFVERVLRVDLFELAPDAAGPIDFAEMAESGSEYDTGKIRPGHEENPLPPPFRTCRQTGMPYRGKGEIAH